jgi:hypothetical protein
VTACEYHYPFANGKHHIRRSCSCLGMLEERVVIRDFHPLLRKGPCKFKVRFNSVDVVCMLLDVKNCLSHVYVNKSSSHFN